MAGFAAVDLSKLPAPDVVEALDYETILASMLDAVKASDPSFTALVESDPVYKILEACAYVALNLRQRVNDAARANMLAYATGADLDHLGALLGVERFMLDPGDADLGIDPTYETDTDFRRRITLAPEGYSVAGPEGAYIFHALSAAADVLDASATSPSPGEVVVSLLSRTGSGEADAALLETVGAVLTADDVRPLTDHVTVQSAVIVPYTVDATIYTYAGPDASVVLQASRDRLDAYIAESHRIGRDITMSGIYSVLHSAGVQRVELAEPTADVVIDRTQAAYCTGITITSGGVDE